MKKAQFKTMAALLALCCMFVFQRVRWRSLQHGGVHGRAGDCQHRGACRTRRKNRTCRNLPVQRCHRQQAQWRIYPNRPHRHAPQFVGLSGQSDRGFGYTHCPDICPTTLSELAAFMNLLGEKAKQVQVLFISVDPARDTPTCWHSMCLRSTLALSD